MVFCSAGASNGFSTYSDTPAWRASSRFSRRLSAVTMMNGRSRHAGPATAAFSWTTAANLTATDNTFDMAIQGNGFFQIQLLSGETAYTRDGTFQLNADGQVVTHDGYTVLPGITVPNNAVDVSINSSGEVLVKLENQVNLSNVGQLQISVFPNDPGLEAIGDNLYLETPASGSPTTGAPASTGFGSILQGFLETSNVNAVEEISNLISAQRAYEMNSKVIQTADEMMGTLSNMR